MLNLNLKSRLFQDEIDALS